MNKFQRAQLDQIVAFCSEPRSWRDIAAHIKVSKASSTIRTRALKSGEIVLDQAFINGCNPRYITALKIQRIRSISADLMHWSEGQSVRDSYRVSTLACEFRSAM